MIVAEILAVSLVIAVASMVFAGILAVVPAVASMIVAGILADALVPAVA